MSAAIPGIHHITAICGAPQTNLKFYNGLLHQRLVKKTVNFDDPGTYHLYYGDRAGSPGSILTFFPFVDAEDGRTGPGMASAFAYAVPGGEAAFTGLMERFADEGLMFDGPAERFGERVVALDDPDGLRVEFVETHGDGAEAVSHFHSVTLWLHDFGPTARVLTDIFGFEAGDEAQEGTFTRQRFTATGGGGIVDLVRSDGRRYARQGKGTIHHVAFRAESEAVQREWRERLAGAGFDVTPVIDRQYFNAIYFREPGGVLFEIATDPPGFAVDEPAETMGSALMLPPQYEGHRREIEAVLPPLPVPPVPVA